MATTDTTSGLSSLPSNIMTTTKYKEQQQAAAAKKSNNMDQTAFLTLFTTQLKNQDPTDPVKNEAFVAQLAQFSQLEATTAMKTSMDALVASMSNDRMLGAASLMGKQVAVPDGPVVVNGLNVSQATINLPAGADGIKLEVLDINGSIVRSQILGPQPPGDLTLSWDGMTNAGSAASDGIYSYVATVNSKGQITKPTVNTYATVSAVKSAGTSDGTMLLEVAGGKTVNISDVKRISN